jgi:hypothetical protein
MGFVQLIECILPILLHLGFIVRRIHGAPWLRSVGRTASAPYTMKNGVKLVDRFGVILRPQSTAGTSPPIAP